MFRPRCVCGHQFMQVQDQPAQMWNQAQAALSKISPQQMSMKQTQPPQQTFYMAPPETLKLYEHQMASPGQPPLSNLEKKAKFPNVKMPDFYWEPSYQMGDSPAVLSDRMKSPVAACPKQDSSAGPRGPPFEVSWAEVHQEEEEAEEGCPAAVTALISCVVIGYF